MTLEEKAKNYAWNYPIPYSLYEKIGDKKKLLIDVLEQVYIAGAIENGIVWHDLKKNPDDVPENDREVLNEIGIEVRYIGDCWVYVYMEETTNADVVAWCEIPEFNEK